MDKVMLSVASAIVLAASLAFVILPEVQADRPVDVLLYGYTEDTTKAQMEPIHKSALESHGYVVEVGTGKIDAAEMEDAKVVVVGKGLNYDDGSIEAVIDYVYDGGRLLLLPNTQYQYCFPFSDDSPCKFDFTRDAFGFEFGGSVQYSTIYPEPGQEVHPLWNVPNKVTKFTDWCCDAYVDEIIDEDNITVLSTVSGQSYRPTGYYSVQDVPAIIVNNNPEWGGGMVVGAGKHMVIGWHGPDTRLLENVVTFMLDDDGSHGTAPVIKGVEDVTFSASGASAQVSREMLGDITAVDAHDPDPWLEGYAVSFSPVEQASGPFIIQDTNEFPVGTTVITWFARDAANNVATMVQRVEVIPRFEAITDGFDDGQEWDEFGMVAEHTRSSRPANTVFERYEFSIDSNEGAPAPSARISGDGFASYAGIQREIRLDHLGGDSLYVGADYTAGSDTTVPFVVNANLQILDKNENLLWGSWLVRDGTLGGGWQTFRYDVTEAVSGHDVVTVRLGMFDYWGPSLNVEAYFDNFYAGTEPLKESHE